MSKFTNALVPSVQGLIDALQVSVMTLSEIQEDPRLAKAFENMPSHYLGCYHPVEDVIMIRDEYLHNSTEIILHELIHWAGAEGRLNRKWITKSRAAMMTADLDVIMDLNETRDTEEATAQIGMLKLVLVLGLNPAEYSDKTLSYLEDLLSFNLAKADRDSDKAVEYLVGFLGMRKAA